MKASITAATLVERLFSILIPSHYLKGKHAFRAKVLCVFSMTLGGLALIILSGLIASEGEVPLRRLGTIILSSLFLFVPFVMRLSERIAVPATYTIFVSLMVVWYVDYNNASVMGASTPLWVILYCLAALTFKGRGLFLALFVISSIYLLDLYLLFNGLLPESITKPHVWPKLEAAQLLGAGVIIVVCTRGMARLAMEHMTELQQELVAKQDRIQEINALKTKAEVSAQSKTMFLATMSHELRTPLNSVIGNAQLLSRESLPDASQQKIEDITKAGNLLLMLINDILDFSKLEQNRLKLIAQPYNLSQQLLDICRMMDAKVKTGVTLQTCLPHQAIYINADENRLAQVFLNMLSNAIKFTNKGEISIGLKTVDEKNVHVWVNDTGIGIRQADLDRLFESFTQVTGDSDLNMQGTGLGLAISKGIIDQMGGSITVTSEYGEGTCFDLVFPDCLVDGPSESAEVMPLHEAEISLKGLSILVVDDIPMNCVVLEGMLGEFGCDQVTVVNSGQEAINVIQNHMAIECVLMDVRMPGMSGDKASEQLRALGYQGKIIAVTANASPEDQLACEKAGMDAFIPKPVEMGMLKTTLQKLLLPAN